MENHHHPNRNQRFHEGMENHPSPNRNHHHHPPNRNHNFHEGMGNHPNHANHQSPNHSHRYEEEIHDTLLCMKIHCCEKCPRALEKFLRRMPEVECVSFVDKDLVKVSSYIEPETLLEEVKKLGKRVRLMPMEELARRKKHAQEAIVEEPHNCSDLYEAPKINEMVCRDFLCKQHPRSRPIYGNKLEDESFPFFGFSPFGPSMILSGYQQPPYGYQQTPYGYQQPPPYGYPQPQYPQIFPPQ